MSTVGATWMLVGSAFHKMPPIYMGALLVALVLGTGTASGLPACVLVGKSL